MNWFLLTLVLFQAIGHVFTLIEAKHFPAAVVVISTWWFVAYMAGIFTLF